MKAFLDRLRRCERSTADGHGAFINKPMIAVAAAGGSGNGIVSCLSCLERWIRHVSGRKVDFIGVTRFNRAYKLAQIARAAEFMVTEFSSA